MRHAERWFRAISRILVLGCAALAFAAWKDTQPSSDSIWSVVVGVLLPLICILAIFAAILWKTTYTIRRARRPDQKIAQWTVSPATWEAFRQQDLQRAAELKSYMHVFKPRKRSAPLEVLAAKSGILVDGIFLTLEPRGLGAMTALQWLSGKPEMMEFAIRVPIGGSTTTAIRTTPGAARVPVEPASREAAALAFEHFRKLLARGEMADPGGHRLAVRLATGLALGLLAAGLVGLAMNRSGDDRPWVMLMGLIGLIGGIGAAAFAGIVWAVMLKK